MLAVAACRRGSPAPMLLPIVDGTLEVEGIAAPARIVRDRWGVPHVYAESRDDLFFAQGFVQAEDRLFQMDLWRRSAQGRLAEVLGANFIERDAMTRRLQYQGDPATDWASYGPATRQMADAFVRGINAWVSVAREQPPELFRLAGWLPDEWAADDLLNRTDAFDRDGTIADAAAQGLPETVVDSVRRAAVPPFFTGLAAPVLNAPGARPVAALKAPSDRAPSPSRLYLIHLHSPAWNAVGATPPWRPGLTVGHDGTASWDRAERTYRGVVRAEPLDAASGRVVTDTIAVKGRVEPFAYETRITAHGVVIATDRAASRQFSLGWQGHQPATSPAFYTPARDGAVPAREAMAGSNRVLFQHPLAISTAARDRLNIGPLPRPASNDPFFRVMWDARTWDGSRAMNAPGQAEWPASVHYSDLAGLWASGQTMLLVYSDEAVKANAEATLTLAPRRRR